MSCSTTLENVSSDYLVALTEFVCFVESSAYGGLPRCSTRPHAIPNCQNLALIPPLNGIVSTCASLRRVSEPFGFGCALWGFTVATGSGLVEIYHRSRTRGGPWTSSGWWRAGAFLRSPNQSGRRPGAVTTRSAVPHELPRAPSAPSRVREAAAALLPVPVRRG